jgi:hypothetical protein
MNAAANNMPTKSTPQALLELADAGHERAEEIRTKVSLLRSEIRQLRNAKTPETVRTINRRVVKAYADVRYLWIEVHSAPPASQDR